MTEIGELSVEELERWRKAVLDLCSQHADCARDCGALARGIASPDLIRDMKEQP